MDWCIYCTLFAAASLLFFILNVFRSIHEEAHTNECFISCDGHQLHDFKGRSVDLEVDGVRYIEMHRGLIRARPTSFKGRISLTRGWSQCVLMKIWRSTWNTYLVWHLNIVVR